MEHYLPILFNLNNVTVFPVIRPIHAVVRQCVGRDVPNVHT